MLQCVVLCGGLATRLRPITETIPKSLIAINSEPFLSHQLSLLRSQGVQNVVLCVGYLGEMIQEFAGDGSRFGMSLTYSFDGPSLRGTAGAIRNALPLLNESFFVLYGDSYLPCNYGSVVETFLTSGRPAVMTIYRNQGQYDSSNVEAAAGLILRYDKRDRTPAMQYIDYGLGVFRRSVFEQPPANPEDDLAQVYQRLLANGSLASHEVRQRFYEIGSKQGISDLEQYLSGCTHGDAANGSECQTEVIR
ncbi:MAG: Nucleotidyl transferase [Bryobacterales bacterium]|jgi:N-acetyl-alpha-D-muramate 1-phosphate uridylyltransferase|nr:Nucleotidyl transferase [Bryobacterales bacterium]